jgi:hypothetical protein
MSMIAVSTEIGIDTRGLRLDQAVEEFEEELAYRIVDEARRLIDESKPSGRIYRRGSIKGSRTKEGIEAGLRRSGKTRMIVGSRFHRASAPGQPLAEDSGESYRDITVRRIGSGNYRVRFGGWTGYWEFVVPPDLQRPTVMPAIEAAVKKTFGESQIFS